MTRSFLIAAGSLFAFAATVSADLQRFHFSEPHMGTMVRITAFAPDPSAAESAARQAFDRIAELNRILSDYDPESELSHLSQAAPGEPAPVSDDLFQVLDRAQEIAALSHGAFDITIGSIGQLWRDARRNRKLPDPAEIERLQKSVGFRQLKLDPDRQTATLCRDGIKLDLGGIAKGYAAAEMLETLRKAGLPRSLIAVGGDLAIGDSPPKRDGWKIGLSSIDPDAIERTLLLRNVSVSTSGDTEQFVEIDGIRYSHILDPRTGIGLTQRISVTVVASDGAAADALATAASVLGVEKGLALIETFPNAEAFFLLATEEGKKAVASAGFPAAIP